jgi:hypothetical protein
MPVERKRTDDGLGVIIIGSGAVTEAEYLDFYTKELSVGAEVSEYPRYGLNDFSEVTSVTIASSAVSTIASYSKKAAEANPDCITAIVADKDVIFGLARMWELMSSDAPMEIMVFRDRAEAEEWIRQEAKARFQIDGLTFS